MPSKSTSNPATKAAASAAAAVAREQKDQREAFDQAMQHFHARDLKKAKQLFEKAADGPIKDMAVAARTHAKMCEQRLARASVVLETHDDFYNYAVSLMNRQDFRGAHDHFEKSLALKETDYCHYGLAACYGFLGRVEDAARHLRRAIEMRPDNRAAAHNDPDFAELNRQPLIRELLQHHA